MWMAYVKDIEVSDLQSGVEYLSQTFSNLSFDARHEAVYGMGRLMSPERCEKLADNYDNGEEVCQQYLDGQLDVRELCEKLKAMALAGFLYRIRNVLPDAICSIYCPDTDDEVTNSDDDNTC